MPIIRGDDRQRLVPSALVSVLTTLINELSEMPDYRVVELKDLQRRLCRLYGLPAPFTDEANATDVAQHLAEEDGIPLED